MATINIGITGATGFIGSHLTKFLSKKKIRYHVFSGDLLKKTNVHTFFKHFKITHIIHLAGTFNPPFQNLIKKNLLTTQNLLEIGKGYSLKKIIYTSSGAVYGEPKNKYSSENDLLLPNTEYGLAKLLTEQTIAYYHKNYGIDSVILRLPHVYGEKNTKGVIYHFLHDIKTKKEITIEGDGQQRRNFLYVDDACRAIEKAIFYDKSDIFNIASDKDYSLLDIVSSLTKKYSFSTRYKKANNRLKNLILDTNKAKRVLNFSSKYDLLLDL